MTPTADATLASLESSAAAHLNHEDARRVRQLLQVAHRDLRRALALGSDGDVEREAQRVAGLAHVLRYLQLQERRALSRADVLVGHVSRVVRPHRRTSTPPPGGVPPYDGRKPRA